jgi:hypothetical protein
MITQRVAGYPAHRQGARRGWEAVGERRQRDQREKVMISMLVPLFPGDEGSNEGL